MSAAGFIPLTDPKDDVYRLIPVAPHEFRHQVMGCVSELHWLLALDPEFEEAWEEGHPAVHISITVSHYYRDNSDFHDWILALREFFKEHQVYDDTVYDRERDCTSYLITLCARHL